MIAAAQELRRSGARADQIVTEQLFGVDIDPQAVATARKRLEDWAAQHVASPVEVPDDHLLVADGLEATMVPEWNHSMDLVIGNPPFGSQLKSPTARPLDEQRALAERFGIGALGYADTASLFLLRAFELVRPGGTVSLILPASLAAARDAAAVRAHVERRATVTAVWVDEGDVGFDAAVAVWAPMFVAREPTGSTQLARRYRGARVVESDRIEYRPDRSSWSELLGDPLPGVRRGVIERLDAATTVLGDVAGVVAGFRHHYYGLVPFVHEARASGIGAGPRLVTTGAIDPFRLRTDAPVRFARRKFTDPIVDVASVERSDSCLAGWLRQIGGPKVLVASQGRVVEALIDDTGGFVPSTPVLAVVPDRVTPLSPAHLAALVGSPVASWLLHRAAAGSGMGRGSCRVTAGFLASLPLPDDPDAWNRAAAAARLAQQAADEGNAEAWATELDVVGVQMCRAHGIDGGDPIINWWRDQRPPWRNARPWMP